MTPAQFKHLRLLCGASQPRIGKLLGVSDQMVYLWERGKSPVKVTAATCMMLLAAEHYRVKMNSWDALIHAHNNTLPDWVPERTSI